jgi:lipoprotein-anchoring transpeptidase ErfK/SrfK
VANMNWFNSKMGDLKNLIADTTGGVAVVPTPHSSATGKSANITTLKENVNKAIDEWALIRGHSWEIPKEVAGTAETWIEVDLSAHMLYAYSGGRLINGFLVATGPSTTPTIAGTFKIYSKFPIYRMRGTGYDLPDVPYVMFYHKSYAIHGVYWHNSFGVSISHGCINMLTSDAAWLYEIVKVNTYVFVHKRW